MNSRILKILWYVAPIGVVLSKWLRGSNSYNNYLIYKNVFWHSIHQTNLYTTYPAEYFDQNLYGPLFALVIAPFAVLPDLLGMMAWGVFSMWVLWKGISYFWGENPSILLFFLLLLEAITSLHNLQYNLLMAGGLLLAFASVKQGKEGLSALLVVVLFLTKIYGVVGFVFVLFSPKPLKFMSYAIFWLFVGLLIPMIFSNPSFLYQSYFDWYNTLVHKNELNQQSYAQVGMQDISFMGLVKRVSGYPSISTLYFLIPGAILSLLPLVRIKNYGSQVFQAHYLSQLLIGVVIFSSSSESSTYVIAVSGYLIWLSDGYKNKSQWALLVLLAVLTVLSPTDLVPSFIRKEYIVKYALKALPCVIAWGLVTRDLLFKNYLDETHEA